MAQHFRPDRTESASSNENALIQATDILPGKLNDNSNITNGLPAERRLAESRRDGFWRSFLYGNFRPRRRSSRRTADEHQFLFDWHEPRVLYLALAVLLLSCTDALFTLNLLKAGATEANAVMAAMLTDSVDRFLVVKISLTSFSLIILGIAARRKFFKSISVENLLQFFCAGYILLICYELYMFKFVFKLSIPLLG